MTDPHFLTERLRLEFRPSFTRETTQRFLGLATLQWRHRALNLNETSTAADTQCYLVQKGETFVVRADLAWSPYARPIGAYITVGQTF